MTCIQSCGLCCGIFSVFAIVFLCVVGAILNSGSEVIDVTTEADRTRSVTNCWIGAAIYAGFFVVSLLCYFVPCPGRKEAPADSRQRLMAIKQDE
jgi:hypothetical protein